MTCRTRSAEDIVFYGLWEAIAGASCPLPPAPCPLPPTAKVMSYSNSADLTNKPGDKWETSNKKCTPKLWQENYWRLPEIGKRVIYENRCHTIHLQSTHAAGTTAVHLNDNLSQWLETELWKIGSLANGNGRLATWMDISKNDFWIIFIYWSKYETRNNFSRQQLSPAPVSSLWTKQESTSLMYFHDKIHAGEEK